MAISFTADSPGNTDRVSYANVLDANLTALTVSGWAYADDATASRSETLFCVNDSGDSNGMLIVYLTSGNRPQMFRRNGTGAYSRYYDAASYTSGQWQHWCAVFDNSRTSPNGWKLYLNGVEPGGATNNSSGAGNTLNADGTWVVGNQKGNHDRNWEGDLAWFGVWNAELDADEIAALAAGMHPRMVRPSSLKFAPDLIDNAVDTWSQQAGTVTTASGGWADSPRIIRPTAKILRFPATAVEAFSGDAFDTDAFDTNAWALSAATGLAPIEVPLGASSVTGQAPLARWTAITAPAGSMSATGAAPTEALSAATVPAGAVSTGGAVPSLTLSAALVLQGQATAAGQIPFLRPSLLGVPAGVVTAGSSPPVLALSGVAVGQGSGSATGFAPSTGMDPIDVPGGTVTVTGTVPLVDPYLVPTGGVSASGWAPATALTGVATPGGLVTADGQVPEQVVSSVEIPGGAVALSGLTPLLRPSALWVGQGTITMGGSAPTLIQSGLGVPAGAVTTAGQVPDVFSDTIPVPLGAVLAAGAVPSTSTSQGEGDDPLACLRPVVSTVLKRVI